MCASVVLGQECQECKTYSATICISSDISGNPFQNLKSNDIVVICPKATWTLSQNTELQRGTYYNFGSIKDGSSGNTLKLLDKKTTLNNYGDLDLKQLEVSDATFYNRSSGTVTASSLYFHGDVINDGVMTSNEGCDGSATQNCGLYVGNQGSKKLSGKGVVNAIDANFQGVVDGNQTFKLKGNLRFDKNYSGSDVFYVNEDLIFRNASNISGGMFYLEGDFQCNRRKFSASICNYEGTEMIPVSGCNNGSVNNSDCMKTILPVELLAFEKYEENDELIFMWLSGSETSFDHYELQQSLDGNHFETIEIHFGRGSQTSYQSDKVSRSAARTYYRLRMVDLDGSYQTSHILSADGFKETAAIEVYPNPAIAGQTLTILNPSGKQGVSHIVSMNGQRVHTAIIWEDSDTSITVPSDIPAGTYIIEVIFSDRKLIDRLIIR